MGGVKSFDRFCSSANSISSNSASLCKYNSTNAFLRKYRPQTSSFYWEIENSNSNQFPSQNSINNKLEMIYLPNDVPSVTNFFWSLENRIDIFWKLFPRYPIHWFADDLDTLTECSMILKLKLYVTVYNALAFVHVTTECHSRTQYSNVTLCRIVIHSIHANNSKYQTIINIAFSKMSSDNKKKALFICLGK